jgi:predicted Fe-Mo cluster-binding NifX family protein
VDTLPEGVRNRPGQPCIGLMMSTAERPNPPSMFEPDNANAAVSSQQNPSQSSSLLRVAIASSDGRIVDEHFGSTLQFVIVETNGHIARFVETRANAPPCGDGRHAPGQLEQSVALIADCNVLLAVRAGPPAVALLERQGTCVIQGSTSIADALLRLPTHN